MKVEGVDAINIGDVDLSVSLGIPGQTSHPLIQDANKKAAKMAKDNNKLYGYFCNAPEDARKVKDWEGIGFFLCSIPEQILIPQYPQCTRDHRVFRGRSSILTVETHIFPKSTTGFALEFAFEPGG